MPLSIITRLKLVVFKLKKSHIRSVELRWLSVYVLALTLCWVDIFLNPLLRSLRTIFCKKKYPLLCRWTSNLLGRGRETSIFFLGVGGWGRSGRENLYVM